MCQLVAAERGFTQDLGLLPGLETSPVPADVNIEPWDIGDGLVLQCWHPDTREWATMLQPVEGMVWKMKKGSKLRIVEATDAPPPEPSMVEQVEAVR